MVINYLRRVLGLSAALVALLTLVVLALPALIPAARLQALAEGRLAQALGRPVGLEGISLRLLPVPEIRASSLRVGKGGDLLGRAEDVDLYLDPAGALMGRPLRRLEVRRAIVDPAALLGALVEPAPSGPPALPELRVAHLLPSLESNDPGLAVHFIALPDARWRVDLSRAGDTLTLDTEHSGRALLVGVRAAGWSLPGAPDATLGQIRGQARLSDSGLTLERLTATLQGATLRAALDLALDQGLHQGPAWHAKGSLTLEQVPMGALLAWGGMPRLVSGKASGTLYVAGDASDPGQLMASAAVSGHLELGAGRLMGLDLAAPARHPGIGDYGGGDTPFSSLQLSLERRTPSQWLIDIEALISSRLTARGLLSISGGALLDGSLQVRLGGIGSPEVPLLVAGTAESPRLRVAPEALPGLAPVPAASPAPPPPSIQMSSVTAVPGPAQPALSAPGSASPTVPGAASFQGRSVPPIEQGPAPADRRAPAPVSEIPLPPVKPQRSRSRLDRMSGWWGGSGTGPLVAPVDQAPRPSAAHDGPRGAGPAGGLDGQ
jgi:AsmA-like C-terminal region